MSRKFRIVRHVVTDSERMRIALLASYGLHYRTIAKRIYGSSNRYVPTAREISRVSRVALQEGVSSLDWRRGETDEVNHLIKNVLANRPTTLFRKSLKVARSAG